VVQAISFAIGKITAATDLSWFEIIKGQIFEELLL
jgi:hypothetical protein